LLAIGSCIFFMSDSQLHLTCPAHPPHAGPSINPFPLPVVFFLINYGVHLLLNGLPLFHRLLIPNTSTPSLFFSFVLPPSLLLPLLPLYSLSLHVCRCALWSAFRSLLFRQGAEPTCPPVSTFQRRRAQARTVGRRAFYFLVRGPGGEGVRDGILVQWGLIGGTVEVIPSPCPVSWCGPSLFQGV
jgi:hypothetical protein